MSSVIVVGGGPGGLSAAATLRAAGVTDVTVFDREAAAGGIPRHCMHTGFGLRDLRRPMSGPNYADKLLRGATASGVVVETLSTVTGWTRDETGFSINVTSPNGDDAVRADAIVLATGCRERPRSARLVPGDRPPGVLTTGQLQQLVYVNNSRVGGTAVVVGAEHVSYSAVLTLQHAGCRVVSMVTEHGQPTTFRPFDLAARTRWRFPLYRNSQVTNIVGHDRVRFVEVTDVASGRITKIQCDTVVFTGDWIADHELARRHDVGYDVWSTGLSVDSRWRTTVPGVFSVGNLNHPAETADVCSVAGRRMSAGVVEWLRFRTWPDMQARITVAEPLQWVSPSRVTDRAAPTGSRLVLRSSAFARLPVIRVRQAGRVLWKRRVPWIVPTRSLSIPSTWLGAVDTGSDVLIDLA